MHYWKKQTMLISALEDSRFKSIEGNALCEDPLCTCIQLNLESYYCILHLLILAMGRVFTPLVLLDWLLIPSQVLAKTRNG